MKGKLFAWAAALLLVAGILVSTPVANAAPEHAQEHCICVGSEHIADHSGCQKAQFKNISEAYSGAGKIHFATSGAYYLSQDEEREVSIAPGVEVSICLNGYTLHGKKTITVQEGSTVNLCDCTGQGQVTTTWVSTVNEEDRGWAVRLEKGSFNLYSGTISGKGTERTHHARSVFVTEGYFNMYGGIITGGYAVSSEKLVARGGNVYISKGNFRMQGGTITSGTADQHGGNIYIASGRLDIENGLITKGSADTHGGNICAFGGVVKIGADAVVSKGTAAMKGGNIAVIGSGGVAAVHVSGTVSNGVAGTYGGNISVNKGGDNGGELYLNDGCVITDGKSRAHSGVKGGGGNLHMHGASSRIVMEGGQILNGQAAAAPGGNVFLEAGTFEVRNGTISGGLSAFEGGNVHVESNAALTLSAGSISGGSTTDTDDDGNGGNLFTEGSVKISAGFEIFDGKAYSGGNIAVGEDGTVEMSGGRIYGGQASNTGGNVLCQNSFKMYKGEICDGQAQRDGGNVYVTGMYSGEIVGEFTMVGGSITGGTAGSGTYGANLAVVNAGEAVLRGGTIADGKTDHGLWDVSVNIDGIYRGAPLITVSGDAQFNLRIDNTTAYEKMGTFYQAAAQFQELSEEADIRLDITDPKSYEGVVADETCTGAVSSARSGYRVVYKAAANMLNLQKINYVLIVLAAVAVVAAVVVLYIVKKRKK